MSVAPRVGFLGAGRMAEAMIAGMVKSSFAPADMVFYDINAKRRELIQGASHQSL
jgi:pyrroline-5-carboxylate reductase